MKKDPEFDDDVIAKLVDPVDLRDDCDRCLRLRVMSLRSDWVLHVEFYTNHPMERSLQVLKHMEFLKDIESYLLFEFDVHHLMAELDSNLNPERKASHIQRLETAVRKTIRSFLKILDQRSQDWNSSREKLSETP